MIIDNKVVALLLSCAICVGTTSSVSAVDIEKKVNSGVSFSERASKYWNSFKKDVALGSFSIASFLGFIYQTVSKNKVAKEIEEANRQRDEANQRAEEANGQRDEANQRAEEANRQRNEANQRAEEANRQGNEANRQKDEEIAQANRQRNEANQRAEEANRQRNEANQRAEEANRQRDEANRQRDEANRQRDEANRQRDEANGQRDDANRQRNEANRQRDEANGQRDDANRQRDDANQRAERAEAAQKACSDRLRNLEQQNGELIKENDRYRARFVTIVTPGGMFSRATSRDDYFHDQQERFLNALEYTEGKWGNFSIWNEGGKGNKHFRNNVEKAKEIYLARFNSTPEEQRYGVGLELASAYFDKFIAPHSTRR